MTQLKLFKLATGLLFFFNLVVVVFLMITRPKPPRGLAGRHFESKAVEILKLDDAQEALFLKLASEHGDKIKAQSKLQSELLQKYFLGLENDSVSRNKEVILEEIQKHNLNQIEITYLHFQDVKMLRNEDQSNEFELFIKEAVRKIMPPAI